MTLTMHKLATATFIPLLESLQGLVDKGKAHAEATGKDLINARLAADMFTFAEQVNAACRFARDAMARLSGQEGPPHLGPKTGWDELKAQVDEAAAFVRTVPASAFEGAESRDCTLELPSGAVLPLDASQFLLGFTLPNFHFHLVTAYDILRHHGVELGKRDYMAGLASIMRPK